MNKKEEGYLELILGPMFSCKSSELIKRYRLYKCLNKEVLLINHISNKGICTHLKPLATPLCIKCIFRIF